jgi:hypothetical protein
MAFSRAGLSVLVIPRRIAEELEKKGISLEEAVIDALAKLAEMDPKALAEARLELAGRYLEEGRRLIDNDPVQASEKLYKAAEECVKALAVHFNFDGILRKVEERGRWSVTELEKAVLRISERLGSWFSSAWDQAWTLHVWRFHEAKFDAEDVRARFPSVEKMVEEASKLVKGQDKG